MRDWITNELHSGKRCHSRIDVSLLNSSIGLVYGDVKIERSSSLLVYIPRYFTSHASLHPKRRPGQRSVAVILAREQRQSCVPQQNGACSKWTRYPLRAK